MSVAAVLLESPWGVGYGATSHAPPLFMRIL